MQDGHPLRFKLADHKLGRHPSLLVIPTADPEYIDIAPVRHLGVGGGRRDHWDTCTVIYLGGRNRSAGVPVTDHAHHTGVHEFVCDRHGLLGVMLVVSYQELDLFPQDSTPLIPLGHREFDAVLQIITLFALIPGHRSGYRNPDAARLSLGASCH